MRLEPGIFREYDIRGIVPEQLDAEVAQRIGVAIGTIARAKGQSTMAVGRDGRHSSAELAEALIRGLRRSGQDVVDIGMVPTPVLYFATFFLGTEGGVMVTGSHNDPEYNGFKITLAGASLCGSGIREILEKIRQNDQVSDEVEGKLSQTDVAEEYVRRIVQDVGTSPRAPKRVVIDAGNGVAGPLAVQLVEALGHEALPLYCDVDGNFPNHRADPSQPENLVEIVDAVRSRQADVGFALDGDGDRLGVVDSSGKVIWPDRQLMLLAQDVLSRNAGGRIIYDVKCSRHLRTVIEDAGGRPIMYKTGHSLIKNKMIEEGALLAGEMSGHIFFKERWYGFDDALCAASRLMEIFAKPSGASTAEIFAALPEGVATPELRLPMSEERHAEFMRGVKATLNMDGARLLTIDGLRVEQANAWGLIRPSNTSPCIVLRFEADDQSALEMIQGRFRAAIKEACPEAQPPF